MKTLYAIGRPFLLLLVLGLASCTLTDPLYRDGLWRPNGANTQNLRVMVVEQGDLNRGRGEPGSDGPEAVAAVQRLRAGKVKEITTQSSQSNGGGS
jgi:hypothetical protein